MGIQQQKKWRATHDLRTRHAHRMLDGEIVPYDQPFTAGGAPIMFPGDPSAPPAMVYNCRCTMQTGNDIELEAEPHEMRVRDPITGRNIVVTDEGFEEWKQKNWGVTPKKVANPSDGDIIKEKSTKASGKIQTGGQILDYYEWETKRTKKASVKYEEIRNTDDIEAIAKSSGFSKEEIETIKKHIFFDEHQLYDEVGRFEPSYDMAVAWKRLADGKPKERDIMLLHHELIENQVEKEYNLTAAEAHAIAKSKYNWEQKLFDDVGDGEPDGLL